MSRHIFPTIFSRFLQQFPAVDLQLSVEFPEQLFAALLANTLDVACYVDVRTPHGITVQPVGRDELIIIASPQHALAGHRRVTPQQLSTHPFVAAGSGLFREMIEANLRAAGISPQSMAEARHQEAAKTLVERNIGYSVVMRSSVADELSGGRLVRLNLDGPPIHATIVAAFRSRASVPPIVHDFIRFVQAELPRVLTPPRSRSHRRGRRVAAKRRQRA